MNDIKEYFTANKHPLISRSARINQRLLATTDLDPDAPSLCRSGPVCQLWRQADGSGDAESTRPDGTHTRNLISVQQRRPNWMDAAINVTNVFTFWVLFRYLCCQQNYERPGGSTVLAHTCLTNFENNYFNRRLYYLPVVHWHRLNGRS